MKTPTAVPEATTAASGIGSPPSVTGGRRYASAAATTSDAAAWCFE
ncbi:hypothetical protein [Natrinema salifodinae]|nr:hypothetical protein [Natrinema salifodinae]